MLRVPRPGGLGLNAVEDVAVETRDEGVGVASQARHELLDGSRVGAPARVAAQRHPVPPVAGAPHRLHCVEPQRMREGQARGVLGDPADVEPAQERGALAGLAVGRGHQGVEIRVGGRARPVDRGADPRVLLRIGAPGEPVQGGAQLDLDGSGARARLQRREGRQDDGLIGPLGAERVVPGPGTADHLRQPSIRLGRLGEQVRTALGDRQELHQLRGPGGRSHGQHRDERRIPHRWVQLPEQLDRLPAHLLGRARSQGRDQVGSGAGPWRVDRHVLEHVAPPVEVQLAHDGGGQRVRVPGEVVGHTGQVGR